MSSFFQDLRYAVRTLSQSPGFTMVLILTLALGIGANTTLFSLVNAILFRPPPISHPEEVVEVFTSDYDGSRYGASSYMDYMDFRERNDLFSDLLAFAVLPISVSHGDVAIRGNGALVTANYFSLLDITPVLGRGFTPQDAEHSETQLTAVLSYGLWQRLYGGDPNLIGQSITLNGLVFTIIGVAPASFTGTQRGVSIDVWAPLTIERQITRMPYSLLDRGTPWLSVLGRLNAGITPSRAQAQMDVISGQLHQAYPDVWKDTRQQPRSVTVLPERETRIPMHLRDDVMDFIGMLSVVVVFVLLIACANVANMMLGRTIGRRQEIAIRLALGVGRWRLMRQLLTESVLLSLVAGIAGLLMALWGMDLLLVIQPALPAPVLLDASLDGHVLLFTFGIALLTGLLFGIVPALQASSRNPLSALQAASTIVGEGVRLSRLRSGLVVIQIALSLLLLIGAGLFMRSLREAYNIDVGFDPENVLMLSVDLHQQGYDSGASAEFYTRLLERVRTLPEAASVSLAAVLPLGGGPGHRMISLDTGTPASSGDAEILMNLVGPGYFDTMRTPLVKGRDFSDRDDNGSPYVVVINETFARRYLPDQEPINRKIRLDVVGEGAEFTIIGVARDGKYRALEEKAIPLFYLPILQHSEILHNLQTGVTLLVRGDHDPVAMAPAVQNAAQSLDTRLPVFNLTTLEEHTSVAYLPVRFGGVILSLFGSIALVIAAIGIYGVMTYSVSRRTHEIGMRIALGAHKRDVMRLILGQAITVTVVGVGIGLAAAFGLMPLLSRYLYGVSATDPLTFTGIAALLTGVALLASYIPARRAMQVEPMQVLRHE